MLSPKKHGQVSFNKKDYQDAVLVFKTATPHNTTTSTHTGGKKYSSSSNKKESCSQKNNFIVWSYLLEICYAGMKRRALKAKDDCSFWLSEKHRKGFSKINNGLQSSLHVCIISHPRLIQSLITNDCIAVRFDYEIRGVNTEQRQKVLLHVYVRKLHIDMQKNTLLGFTWNTTKNDLSA